MAETNKYIYANWVEIHRALSLLASRLRREYNPDVIIAIAKGGLIPSRILGDLLGVKDYGYIGVKFYLSVDKRGEKPYVLFTWLPPLDNKRVLIVDDVVESGRTLSIGIDLISKYNYAAARTLALFVKPWSPIKPDYYYREVDKWVVFPWEICETLREGLDVSPGVEDPSILRSCTE